MKSKIIYAHRGARALYPENTLEAFDACVKAGILHLDMDIALSADKVFIVSHDLVLNPNIIKYQDKFISQTTNKIVKNLTINQLQDYTIGLNPLSSYAKFFPNQLCMSNIQIPTLQQVVDHMKITYSNLNLIYQLEIKNDPQNLELCFSNYEIVELLYNFIITNNLLDCVEIQAFDWDLLLRLQNINPNIKTAYLISADELKLIQLDNQDALDYANIFHAGYLLKNFNNSIVNMIKLLGGSFYEPEDVAITRSDVLKAHELGLKVIVWRYVEHTRSIHDLSLIHKLIDFEVDGFILDDPFIKPFY